MLGLMIKITIDATKYSSVKWKLVFKFESFMYLALNSSTAKVIRSTVPRNMALTRSRTSKIRI